MKKLNDEQARAYIQGEAPFAAEQWEKEHVERLHKNVCEYIKSFGVSCLNKENLLRTVSKYIQNHTNAPNVSILKNLRKKINDMEE